MAISFLENIVTYSERFQSYYDELGFEAVETDRGVWFFDGKIAKYTGPLENINPGVNLPFLNRASLICYSWQASPAYHHGVKTYMLTKEVHTNLDELETVHRIYLERDMSVFRTRRVEADEVSNNLTTLLNKIDASAYKDCSFSPIYWDYYLGNSIAIDRKYEDIVQYFGIFFESRMIGYAKFFVFGKEEAQLQEFMVDPDFEYLKVGLSASYYFSNYYLKENDYGVLNLGFPYSYSQKQFSDELINQYHFNKTPTKFNILIPTEKKWSFDLNNYIFKYFIKQSYALKKIRKVKKYLNFI